MGHKILFIAWLKICDGCYKPNSLPAIKTSKKRNLHQMSCNDECPVNMFCLLHFKFKPPFAQLYDEEHGAPKLQFSAPIFGWKKISVGNLYDIICDCDMSRTFSFSVSFLWCLPKIFSWICLPWLLLQCYQAFTLFLAILFSLRNSIYCAHLW